jgi:hypothetical protein
MHEQPELQTTEFSFSETGSLPTQDAIDEMLSAPGIDAVSFDEHSLRVSFNPFRTSEVAIRNRMAAAGLPEIEATPIRGKRRNLFQRMVDRLAAENKSSLGSGRLDCCELNKANRS